MRFDGRPARGVVVVLVALLASAPVAAQDASELFARATAAFEQEDFRTALSQFEAARDAGMSGPAIEYNIAVCHYRLGEWAEAEAAFAALADRYPRMRALASYNRGLALDRLGRRDAAREALETARRGPDERVTALAEAMLTRLGVDDDGAAAAGRWIKYLDVGLGHDDNVALVDELQLPISTSADSPFTEIYGQVGGPLSPGGPWRLDASAYLARYADADEFDQAVLALGLARAWHRGAWRIDAGPYASHSTLDGDGFESRLGGQLRARRTVDESSSITLRVAHEEIDSGAARFWFVEGDRDFVRARYERRTGSGRWRADFDHERNDRAAAGVSPIRSRFGVSYRRPLTRAWYGELRYSHRTSRYDDSSAPRDETLDALALTTGRSLGARWQGRVQYELSRNDSDDLRYAYRRHRVSVSLGRLF